MKKIIACILTLVMLLSLGVPAFAADKQGTDIPNIYLQGQGRYIYAADGTLIFDGGDLPEGFLADAVQQCMPSFITAVQKDDQESWDAYRAKFSEVVIPAFNGWGLDKNGEPSDGSHILMDWWNAGPAKYGDGSYKLDSYYFFQDWRIDPLQTASILNDFIQKVKADNGADKVNLFGRCEGANVILAYLAEYGAANNYEDVNCVEIYVQSGYGVDLADALYSGEMQFDAAALRRFKETTTLVTIEDQITNALVDALLEFTADTMLLDAGMFGLQVLAPKIYKEIITYTLRETYGRMPGMWSLVGPDYYQKAKKNIFTGYEEEFAGLIEKLDNYDVKVRQRLDDILLDAVQGGVKFANFAKYGNFQVQPLSKNNNEIGDNSVSLKTASIGATTAKFGTTLSASYIEKAKQKGTDKYISPDKMVDASTCLFPDTTWFIFGSTHTQFPEIIHQFMFKFMKANGEMTVFSDTTAPQYMVYSGKEGVDDTIVPMVEENAPSLDSGRVVFKQVNWKEMFQRFWQAILAFIKNLIANRAG